MKIKKKVSLLKKSFMKLPPKLVSTLDQVYVCPLFYDYGGCALAASLRMVWWPQLTLSRGRDEGFSFQFN